MYPRAEDSESQVELIARVHSNRGNRFTPDENTVGANLREKKVHYQGENREISEFIGASFNISETHEAVKL